MTSPVKLGPYKLVRRLGSGAMAEVFLAEAVGASGFAKPVAIKRLLPELAGDGRYERLLVAEGLVGARLRHRNLVQVHELGLAGGEYFLRLDYVDGADLASLLAARGRLSTGLVLLVAEELVEGLRYLHAAVDADGRALGLVHRDVAPPNVLVSRAGEVLLTDYGVAKATLLGDVTRGDVRKGRFAYMSPEQVRGEELDARTDQFSLGATLYELAIGARAFDAESPVAVLDRIRDARPPDLARLDPPLRPLVERLLAAERTGRFAELAEAGRAIAHARRSAELAQPADLARWAFG